MPGFDARADTPIHLLIEVETTDMQYGEFLGQVQHRAGLDSEQAAEKVTRTTLETLSERIGSGEAEDLGAQLPEEIGRHLSKVDDVESFSWDEFVDRLVEREGIESRDDRADSVFHAQVVLDVVADAASPGEMSQVRDQLPGEFDELFELVDQEDGPG